MLSEGQVFAIAASPLWLFWTGERLILAVRALWARRRRRPEPRWSLVIKRPHGGGA